MCNTQLCIGRFSFNQTPLATVIRFLVTRVQARAENTAASNIFSTIGRHLYKMWSTVHRIEKLIRNLLNIDRHEFLRLLVFNFCIYVCRQKLKTLHFPINFLLLADTCARSFLHFFVYKNYFIIYLMLINTCAACHLLFVVCSSSH